MVFSVLLSVKQKFGDKDLDSESDSSSSESEDEDARVSFRLFVWFPHANSFYSPVKTLRLNIRVSANMLIFTKNRDDSRGGGISRGRSRIFQGGGWHLGAAESKEYVPKTLKPKQEILAMPQSRHLP